MSAIAKRLVFDSADLPQELDNAARIRHWRRVFEGGLNPVDVDYLPDRLFHSRLEMTSLNGVTLSRQSGTVHSFSRTRRHIAESPDIGFHFGIVRNCSAVRIAHRGRESVHGDGQALVLNGAEPAFAITDEPLEFVSAMIDRRKMLEWVPGAESITVDGFAPSRQAVHLLARYVDLISDEDIGADAAIDRHVTTTVLDLIALAIGQGRDNLQIARGRGLRAARLAQVIAELGRSFAEPGLSPQSLARRLGISARYVQDLLFEAGSSFTERVLELRLQQARRMLGDPRYDRTNVSDIALTCGFNEISYFNRRFRRRFGAPPTHYRGRPRS